MLLTTLLAWSAAAPAAPSTLSSFTFVAQNASLAEHHRFGFEMGTQFADRIKTRFAAKAGLKMMLAEAATPDGGALLDRFVKFHDREAPAAMAELRGLAKGTGLPFEQVFLQNVPLEFTSCSPALAPKRKTPDDCSDTMACDDGLCAVAHNEDNSKEDVGATALVRATFGATSFVAYTYLGELPSGAFGYNSHGIAFTLNWVGPTAVQCPGLGRGFASRALLEAPTLEAAVSAAAPTTLCAGHNHQLMRTSPPTILNVEAGPRGVYSVRPIGATPFFHANQYETLTSLPQTYGNSSTHRIARAAKLPPPTSTAMMLQILGDQGDVAYPIFHDQLSHDKGDVSGWTIASALFDLRARTLQIFSGNPRDGNVIATEALPAGARGSSVEQISVAA